MFDDGYKEMLNRLNPSKVIFYGSVMSGYDGNVIYIKHQSEYTGEFK